VARARAPVASPPRKTLPLNKWMKQSMDEHRRIILDLLSKGKVTVDEAERLLGALERRLAGGRRDKGVDARRRSTMLPKHLRILLEDDAGGAPPKVNIRVPVQLLRAGVKLQGLLSPETCAHVDVALKEKGAGFGLQEMKSEHVEAFIEAFCRSPFCALGGADRSRLRIFCE
jgi:hypothetical protein